MDWIQFATFMVVNMAFTLTLWLWSRSESRTDHRALESWTKDMISSIQTEMKDFHDRLCAIEERNKGK
jgi:hypothetical protein